MDLSALEKFDKEIKIYNVNSKNSAIQNEILRNQFKMNINFVDDINEEMKTQVHIAQQEIEQVQEQIKVKKE